MSTIHAQIRLAGLHIYKVRAIIQEKTRGKNSTTMIDEDGAPC